MKRTILPRRNIAPVFMSNFGLEVTFDRMDWIPIVSSINPAYRTLVQCFHRLYIERKRYTS